MNLKTWLTSRLTYKTSFSTFSLNSDKYFLIRSHLNACALLKVSPKLMFNIIFLSLLTCRPIFCRLKHSNTL